MKQTSWCKVFLIVAPVVLPAAACKTTSPGTQVKVLNGAELALDNDISRSTVGIVGTTGDYLRACSGTLIHDRRHVLTAWHCVTPLSKAPGDKMGATFGVSRLKPDKTIWGKVISYGGPGASMDQLFGDDLALITLDEDAPAPYVPAVIVPSDLVLSVLDVTTVAGYGTTVPGDRDYVTAGTLHAADVVVESINSHDKTYFETGKEIPGVYTPPTGACHGDSGGPHFIRKNGALYLLGVTHGGDDNCSGRGISKDLRYYHTWIDQAMAGNLAATTMPIAPGFWLDWQKPKDPPIPYCHNYSDTSASHPFSTSEPELKGPGGKCRAYNQ